MTRNNKSEGYPIGDRGKRSGADARQKARDSEEDASKSEGPKGYKGQHTGKGGKHR
jgi:hypothetical protein